MRALLRPRSAVLLLAAMSLTGCAHAWDLDKPCPAGTAWTYCDGVPQCAPAGISPCGPNQAPVR